MSVPTLIASQVTPADPGGALSGPTDWFGVGLMLSIAGCFLLANSILFRHPRALVAQFFGDEEKRLSSIRSYIFHRVQIHLGFLFLLAGFGLQLFGHFGRSAQSPPAERFPVVWVGLVLLAVVVLELMGWWLSHRLFRRYVREYFMTHPPNLESDMGLARELGELFRIPSAGDDSVQAYLQRIRRSIGIPSGPDASPQRRPQGFEESETDEEFELSS